MLRRQGERNLRERRARRLAGIAAAATVLVHATGSAASAPVTIDFESLTANAAVSMRLNPPAGPQFKTGNELFGLNPNCGVPHVDATHPAYSGSKSLVLDGCAPGEFHYSAAYFALGYTTDDILFQVGETLHPSSCPNFICWEIWTTAFDANKNVLSQQQTLLSQFDTFKGVPLHSNAGAIAYVAVEMGSKLPQPNPDSPTGVNLAQSGSYLLLDDLAYNPPSSPPASSFVLGASPASARIALGQQVDLNIPITWFNHPDPSQSPVSLEVYPPAGITGSFNPNPTTSGTSKLTINVAKWAATGNTIVAVTGYVDKGQPSEKHATVNIPVEVVPAFIVTNVGDYTAAPCTPELLGVHIASDGLFSDLVSVGVYTPQDAKIVATSPGTVLNANHAVATLDPHNGADDMTLTLRPDAGAQPTAPGKVYVLADASGYAQQSNPVNDGHVQIVAGEVSKVLLSGAQYTPAFFVPGGFLRKPTRLELQGRGFCPGSKVQFGSAQATPISIASDGRSLTVDVPPTGIDGPLKVIPGGGGAVIDPLTNLSVQNVRARWSLNFANYGADHDFSFGQFEQVFGYDAMHWKIDPCEGLSFGLGHCPVVTPIPDPIAGFIVLALKGHSKEGLCYGFSRTAGQFMGGAAYSGFSPFNAPFPNGLDKSQGLVNLIELNHIHQWDNNVIVAHAAAINSVFSGTPEERAAKLHQQIEAELKAYANAPAGGRSPIIAIADEGAGHAMLVYDLEDLGNGKFKIDVIDPNVPFSANEKTDGADHANRQTMSAITVDPAADPKAQQWVYPFLQEKDGTTSWHGVLDGKSLWVQAQGPTYDLTPKLPGIGSLPSLLVLASDGSTLGQITDGRGRRLVGADGATETGSKRIPGAVAIPPNDAAAGAAPIGYLPLGGDYTISGNRPGNKAGRLTAVTRGFAAAATTTGSGGGLGRQAAASQSVRDRLRVAGSKREAKFTPGAAGNETLTLSASAGGGQMHTVALAGRGTAGASDSMRIASDGAIDIAHTGKAATRTLTLAYFGRSGLPTAARLTGLRLGSGERVILHVRDWVHLRDVTAERRHAGKTSRSAIRLRPVKTALLGRVKLTAQPASGHRLTVAARVTHRGRSAWTTAGVSFVVARGKHVVARKTVPLQASQLADRGGIVTWTLPKRLASGRYSIAAIAIASALDRSGVAQGDLRTARAHARVR